MDNDDILRMGDLVAVRAALVKTRNIDLGVTAFAALLVGIAVYYLKFPNVGVSTIVAALFLLLVGTPVLTQTWRHYRRVLQHVDRVGVRVASGETVYGSKVPFGGAG
ncbi:MAG: hypothetical protein ABIQ97_02100 [Lysobacteraceae bacterium]